MISFSVIIPARNSQATLAMTLESLQEQKLRPSQVIVADGRSSDRTREIARNYGAIVVDNPHVHAAGGRNVGASSATGSWLAFTDSDCKVPQQWLESAAAVIDQMPDVIGLGGPMRALEPLNDIERVAGEAVIHGIFRFPNEARTVTERTLTGAFVTANALYRHDVFQQIGGFSLQHSNFGEDIDLYWRMVARYPGRLRYDPQIFIEHRFPSTWSALTAKWFQYGIISCYLQRYHLGRVRFDGAHYRRLFNALYLSVRDHRNRRYHLARTVQHVAHLFGKYYGSVRLGVVNL